MTSKVWLVFNDAVFSSNMYGNKPVTDCCDEGRALRSISPKLLENKNIELIDIPFDPDVDKLDT